MSQVYFVKNINAGPSGGDENIPQVTPPLLQDDEDDLGNDDEHDGENEDDEGENEEDHCKHEDDEVVFFRWVSLSAAEQIWSLWWTN